jgi:hypothetical protein
MLIMLTLFKKKILEETLNLGLSEDFKLEQLYNKDHNNTYMYNVTNKFLKNMRTFFQWHVFVS